MDKGFRPFLHGKMVTNPAQMRRRVLAAAFGLPLTAQFGPAAFASESHDLPEVPFVATPMKVVARMLDMAQVGPKDYLIDLGCGDGRIVTEAAKRGARAVGIDLDGYLIELCRRRARENDLDKLATFEQKDI